MRKSLFLLLSTLSVLTLTQCFDRDNEVAVSYEPTYRQPLPAATTADEWLDRRLLDLKESQEPELDFLYAELPPEEEWAEAFPELGHPPEKLPQNRHRSWKRNLVGLKERLFAALLREEAEKAETLSRELVNACDISEYDREEARYLILSLSRDPNEGLTWIQENIPKILTPSESSTYSNDNNPEDWQKALADNEVERGIKLLWTKSREDPENANRLDALGRLLTLGTVLSDEKLTNKATTRMIEILEKEYFQTTPEDRLSYYDLSELFAHLSSAKRWKDLSALVSKVEKTVEARNSYGSDSLTPDSLRLITQYHLEDNEAFSSTIEKTISQHKLADLLELLTYSPNREIHLDDLATKSLLENGQKELARKLAYYFLASDPGTDRHYARLLEMDRDGLQEFLPRLLEYDPYEERPLIWQAEIALQDGKLEEARTLIDEAIALDPSDGEQGKDTRMRSYDVLARILEKQGNQEKADFYDDVVKSIREGEAADDYLYAGLIKEATKRYQAALQKFNDAYCLQSRLALTLAKDDRFEEAIPHFEKAFELMPVSFGPRESHCLGCEGIFSDERVQPIAERVLKEFVKNNPENPRAPYLLGMVLEEMKQTDAAIEAYREALKLDPDYFNCANRLENLLAEKPEHFAELKKLRAQLREIASYMRLGEAYTYRTDLKAAWVDANNIAASPLDLPELPVKEDNATEQFSSEYFSHYSARKSQALNGWQRAKILIGNELLQAIGTLNQ